MTVAERRMAHFNLVAMSMRAGVCTEIKCFRPASPMTLKCADCTNAPPAPMCVWCGIAPAEKSAFTETAISCQACRIERNLVRERAGRKSVRTTTAPASTLGARQPTRTPLPDLCLGCGKEPQLTGRRLGARCQANANRAIARA